MGVHGLPIIVVLLNPFQSGPQRQALTGCSHSVKAGRFSHGRVYGQIEGCLTFPLPWGFRE